MADIFLPGDVTNFLAGKNVVFLGDSLVRGLYKDLMWLLNHPSLIPREILGAKGESSFPDLKSCKTSEVTKELMETFPKDNLDKLLDFKGLTSGRSYIEPRKYSNKEHNINITYKFMSRVLPEKNKNSQEDLIDWLNFYEDDKIDIIIMSSCLWDTSRWGPDGPETFKRKLSKLLDLISRILPDSGQFLWLTNPPGAPEINSRGMNIPGLDFQHFTTRYTVIEANNYAAETVAKAGFGVLDLHFYLQMQAGRRNSDGIHWSPETNRLITNLILTHLCLSKSAKLPGNVPANNLALQLAKIRVKSNYGKELEEATEKGGQLFYQQVKKKEQVINDEHQQAAKKRCFQMEQTIESHSKIRGYFSMNNTMHENVYPYSNNSSVNRRYSYDDIPPLNPMIGRSPDDALYDNLSSFYSHQNGSSGFPIPLSTGTDMRGANLRPTYEEEGIACNSQNESLSEMNVQSRYLELYKHREMFIKRKLNDLEKDEIRHQVYDECEQGQNQVTSPFFMPYTSFSNPNQMTFPSFKPIDSFRNQTFIDLFNFNMENGRFRNQTFTGLMERQDERKRQWNNGRINTFNYSF